MIRPARESDMPHLRKMQTGHAWEFGRDMMSCLVVVDENDVPVMAAGAWSKAEVHLLTCDHATPGMRFHEMRQLHAAMEADLLGKGVGEVVTWVDRQTKCGSGVWRAFARRLTRLGWRESTKVSWHRGLGVTQHG